MPRRISRVKPSSKSVVVFITYGIAISVIFLLNFGLLFFESHASSGAQLKIWLFDVGQGDAIFIETPTGEQILIDGGPDRTILSKLGSVLLPWDRMIDAIIPTHPDADHVTGLVSVLERYDVAAIYETGARAFTPMDEALVAAIKEERTMYARLHKGETLIFGEVTIEVVWPEHEFDQVSPKDRNHASLVLLLRYGQTSVLLTGDAEEPAEKQFARNVGDIDVLKVGHHGSASSTSELLLQETMPEIALISCGEKNRYGHPHPAVLSRLDEAEALIFRTDRDGDVLLVSEGGEPEVFPAPLSF